MNLIETIRETIDRHGLIPDDAEVVIGLSGGADSTALLHAFCRLGIPCRAAHLHHGLRGAEADADEAFVRECCNQLAVPLTVERADVRALAEQTGASIEMAARRARHDFFARFEGAVIALAHHADDQVETFLLRLARGAGSEGLGGMAFRRELNGLCIIRPMLMLCRTDITAWLEANGLPWREDESNQADEFLRNRVRNGILPLLERELNPNIRETVLRTMDILRAENEYMDAAAGRMLSGDGRACVTQLEAEATLAQPLALQRRMVRRWLFDQGAEQAGYDVVEDLLALMRQAAGTTVFELNARKRVICEYGTLRLAAGGAAPAPEWILHVDRGSGWRRDPGNDPGRLPAEASFDAARVGDAPIAVRTWRPGDRMTPLGMDGSRKLQDIFTDLKVPRTDRTVLPVVTCRDEIIWIPGFRISRDWAVPSSSAPAIHVRIEQKQAG